MNQRSKRNIIAAMLKAKRPDLANAVAKLRVVTAAEWLPNLLDSKEKQVVHGLVSHVSKTIKWDIMMAGAIAVALLEDVNAHEAAKAVNNLLNKTLLEDVEQTGPEGK